MIDHVGGDDRIGDTKARGILLVGHGTRDKVGTRQFLDLASALAERVSPTAVVPALLEFQSPTIPEAWQTLVDSGVRHVHVAPLLLFAAGHAKRDIPELIEQCREQTPGVSYDQSRPISRHRSLVELAVRRIDETLNKLSASRTAVLVVGRGSHDPCAQADTRLLSEVLSRRLEAARTETAFYAMAEPRLPNVLDRLASSGLYENVVVYPHLLFEGRLFQSIVKQTQDAAEAFPGVRILHASYLGPDPLIADAIAARIEQGTSLRALSSCGARLIKANSSGCTRAHRS